MEFVAFLFVVTFTVSNSAECSRSAVRPRRSAIGETIEELSSKKDPTSTWQSNPLVLYQTTRSGNVSYNQWFHNYDVPSLPVVNARFGYAAARLVYIPNPSTQESQPIELLVVHGGRVSRATYQIYNDIKTEVSDRLQFLTFTLNTVVEMPISVGSNDGSPGGRYLHTAVSFPTLSASGRPVVFYGGLDRQGQVLGGVWHLKASNKENEGLRWTRTAEGPRKCGHSSVTLGHSMLVFGGCNQTMCTNDVQLYNVAQQTWIEVKGTGKIPSPRGGHSAIAVEQASLMFIHGGMKMIMATGSHSNYSVFGDTYVFNMQTRVWQLLELTPPTTALTFTHAASAFFQYSNYGHWVVYGIVGRSLDDLDKKVLAELTIQLSDGSIKSGWEVKNTSHFLQFPIGRIMTALIRFTTSTGDQIAYMIGGARNVKSQHHHLYDPLTDVWLLRQHAGLTGYEWIYVCATSEHPEPRAGQTITVLNGGSIALFGGVEKKFSSGTTFTDSSVWQVSIENLNVLSWKKTIPTSRLLAGIVGHSSVGVSLSSGGSNDTAVTGANTILTFGGFYLDTASLQKSIIIVAPNLLYWHVWSPSKIQLSPCPRAFHSLIVYNSTLYLFGGLGDLSSMNSSALNDTWSLRWSESSAKLGQSSDHDWRQIVANGSSPRGRFGHSAVTYYNESMDESVMLVFGGTDGMTVFDDIWQLSLSTSTWKQLIPYPVVKHAKNNTQLTKAFGHSAAMIGHQMVVYGGCSHPPTNNFLSLSESLPSCPQNYVLDTVVSFDTQTNRWTIVDIIGNRIPRYFHSALFQSSYLIIYGGLSSKDTLYDGTFAIRPGCNRGYEGDFPNGTCIPCPTGYYGNGGDESCQKCDKRFTTNGTAKAWKSDCNICNNNACEHGGKCKFDEKGEFDCHCSPLYTGRYCQNVRDVIIVSVVAGVLLILIIVIGAIARKLILNKRKVSRLQETNKTEISQLQKTNEKEISKLQKVIQSFKDASVHIDINELEFEEEIGEGGYGVVWRCKYRHHAQVALKMLKEEDVDNYINVASFNNSLLRELKCFRTIKHPNILTFYGAGHDQALGGLFLVTELVQPGSLHSVLHTTQNNHGREELFVPLTDRVKVKFCSSICTALGYLHKNLYLHWDLTPHNVLVAIKGEIRLGDFGVSKKARNEEVLRRLQESGTERDTREWLKDFENTGSYDIIDAHAAVDGDQEERQPLIGQQSNEPFKKRIINCYLAPEFFQKKITASSDIYR